MADRIVNRNYHRIVTATETPTTWDRTGIEALGFEGFTKLTQLRAGDVPEKHGIYVVLRPGSEAPVFQADNPVKRPRQKLYSVEYLTDYWVENTPVVYIGKAAGAAGLRDRLKPYAKKSSGHSGGRAIWQLSDADDLLVCWKVIEEAEAVEKFWIKTFKEAHGGMRPFANRNG